MTTTQTFTDTERRTTLAGLLIVFLLSALDQTVVSTAMPRIIAELNGLTLYAWVTTAYLLTSTVMVPIWGKLGDIYGRKPVLLAGIAIFLAGSWLSGLSGEFGDVLGMNGMVQLIVFRALPGHRRRSAVHHRLRDHRRPLSAARAGQVRRHLRLGVRSGQCAGPADRRLFHRPWDGSAAAHTWSPAGAGCSTSTCRSACCRCS